MFHFFSANELELGALPENILSDKYWFYSNFGWLFCHIEERQL